MKEFNTTGVCVPKRHYMVDISGKLAQMIALVDKEKYFTINRGRQYGKTTTLSRLEASLKDRYLVIRLSFEGVDDDNFKNNEEFVRMFVNLVSDVLEKCKIAEDISANWRGILNEIGISGKGFDCLGRGITNLCRSADRPVVLMIDEVDKCSDNQVFLNFLGLLRGKYLEAMDERDMTFHSTVLAGVYDIKNLKLKLNPDEERRYNSPWNIAVDFDTDMSFSAEEIATMLESYEMDAHTGMDIKKVSERLRFYTGGYPFLVSWLCKWMDEKGGKVFTEENVIFAVRELLGTKTTLFDDMFKKVHDYPEYADMLKNMLLRGIEYSYVPNDPVISLGSSFGIFTQIDGKVAVSNIIFETCLYNNFLMEETRRQNHFSYERSQFLTDSGHLDMPHLLRKFQELMYTEYRKSDEAFYERQGGLLFLCFLKPIINGTGSYYVEPRTRGDGRMDIVVFFERVEYIIELKVWRGEKYREKGLKQLAGYMESRNAKNGYLVSFSFNKTKNEIAREVDVEAAGRTYRIYEVII